MHPLPLYVHPQPLVLITACRTCGSCSQHWLKGSSWRRGHGKFSWELSFVGGKAAWLAAKLKYASPNSGVTLSPQLVHILDRSFEVSSWSTLQSHLRDPAVPFTLCHGDFHGGNMFIMGPQHANSMRADCIKLIDWAEAGLWEGTSDLGQFVIASFPAHYFMRTSVTQDALRVYWRRLTAPGSRVAASAFTFEQCWESFCRRGVEWWIWGFVCLAEVPGGDPAVVQYVHDQLLAFINAHDPQEAYIIKSVVVVR